MAMAGTYLGVASAALEETRSHLLRPRPQRGGRGPAAEPVVQHRLGTMWARVERTRRLIYHAAAEAEPGDLKAMPALASAKAEVADAAESTVNGALTLVGGVGYGADSPLHGMLRDARAAHVMSPPPMCCAPGSAGSCWTNRCWASEGERFAACFFDWASGEVRASERGDLLQRLRGVSPLPAPLAHGHGPVGRCPPGQRNPLPRRAATGAGPNETWAAPATLGYGSPRAICAEPWSPARSRGSPPDRGAQVRTAKR
jgi:hypothetical protein